MTDRRGTGGDPDGAAVAAYEVVDVAQGAVDAAEAFVDGHPQEVSGLGGDHAAGVALQEAEAELAFEAFHVLADGRLGAVHVAGHGAERTRLAHRREETKIIKSHFPKLSLG